MKKFIVALLISAMSVSLFACSANKAPEATKPSQTEAQTNASTEEKTDAANDNMTEAPSKETNGEATFGSDILNAFLAMDMTQSAEKLAEDMAAHEVFADYYALMTMPVEEGLLQGFDNFEVKGFTEGATFMPPIMGVPFAAYIFTLADDADADAFMQSLKDNCNPRWNICTEADETIIEKSGNKVLFVMCKFSSTED